MKYLKLFENYDKSIEDQIEDIFSYCGVVDTESNFDLGVGVRYIINDDGTIDVNDGIDLEDKKITELPLLNGKKLFRKIYGFFDCNNNKISSLYGSPESVTGFFDCDNNIIKSLVGSPKSVTGFFSCVHNNITSLVECPKYIGDDLFCENNEIRTFEGFPRSLGGKFHCSGNPIFKLWKLFEDKEKVELFNDFGITDGEVVILDRLNEFLEMIGKPIVIDTSDLEKEGYKII